MSVFNSSLVYWNEKEILPKGMFLTSSGSGGDRLLFWQPSSTSHDVRTHCMAKSPTSDKKADSNTTSTNNPFLLSLISDRLNHTTDNIITNLSMTNNLPRGYPSVFTDRNLIGIGTPNNANLCNANNLTSNSPMGNNTNLSNSNIIHSLCKPDNSDPTTNAGNLVVSSIAGVPTSLLLSLLHEQSQALQRKIFLKLDDNVFIGAAFNLAPSGTELTGLTEEYANSSINNLENDSSMTTHSVISFSVVFLMDSSAPPTVLSYITELARLIGAQIRRAQLVFNYLFDQRSIIVSTLEKLSFTDTDFWSDTTATNSSQQQQINTQSIGIDSPVSIGNNSVNSNCKNMITSNAAVNPTVSNIVNANLQSDNHNSDLKRSSRLNTTTTSPINSNPHDIGNYSENKIKDNDNSRMHDKSSADTMSRNPLERLIHLSTLCADLKRILDSLNKTGHVNMKINGMYPVCFYLPHKAYCLNQNATNDRLIVAIRPSAVWIAIQKIRPYHALILSICKEELFTKNYLPPDANPLLLEFIQSISPTLSLYSLSQKMYFHSFHCLDLAIWLVNRGLAFIVYPIVANNTYILAPFSNLWFTSQLIAQFATTFPDVNFAELLSSFSTGLTLRDHFQTEPTSNGQLPSKDTSSKPSSTRNTFGSKSLWTNLPFDKKINLIAWLLRHRLIIQVHLYVFANFSPIPKSNGHQIESDNDTNEQSIVLEAKQDEAGDNKCHSDELTTHESIEKSKTICETVEPDQIDSQSLNEICCDLPGDLINDLISILPTTSGLNILKSILTHPCTTQSIPLFKLFVRILSHLPAHLEELMFRENVDRATLVECVERFSPFLIVTRLPDPVTACFAGICQPD